MLPEEYRWITAQFEPEGDPWLLLDIARRLEADGNLEGAATVCDRAYGLAPQTEEIVRGRAAALDRLAVVEHGLRFRYVPGGVFLMGDNHGEADEGPWHPVWLSPYWMSETPFSWADYCRLMSWEPPPVGMPGAAEVENGDHRFHLYETNKLRLQYCEDRTTRARGWDAHRPAGRWNQGGRTLTAQEAFGAPERDDPEAPWEYAVKPMVAVAWQEAQELADRLSTEHVRYSLPTEAQWEKAARGGLIGARHAWGNEPPAHDRCDYDRFREFSLLPMKTFAPNGYGLYAMNGCVWEWTRDWYDRDYYRESPEGDPEGPPEGKEKVLRGGSWADCAEVVTVTYRMSRGSAGWRDEGRPAQVAPNIGFRLCRRAVGTRPRRGADASPAGPRRAD
jgi:formylglycine-generating enzyme required for sulfatase activity